MKKKRLWLLVCMVLCCGCTSSSSTTYQDYHKKSYTFPTTYMVDKANVFDYQKGYECAAYSSAYLLRHYDENVKAMNIFSTFPEKLANGEGVYPEGIVKFFKQRGYHASLVEKASIEEVKYEVSKGAPIIVYIHVEKPTTNVHATHYIPIVGYDEDNFYFAESLSQYANKKEDTTLPYNRKTSIEDFKEVWVNIDGVFEQPYFKIEKK